MNSNKIRIGIDVDGVLRDFVGQVNHMVEKETGIAVDTPTEYYYDTLDKTGVSFRKKIWETGEWLDPVFVQAPVLDKAKAGYDMFCDNPNFQVYVVTAQSKGTEEYTTEWLEKNGFNKHFDVVFTHKKLSAPCQVLIDDKPSNIEDYKNNKRLGILINQPYNENFKYNTRVNNLIEAYHEVEKYGN